MANTADLLALLCSLFTLIYCLLIGYRRGKSIDTMDDFFFYGRKLDEGGYQKTFVVTGISLATVLFFFLDFAGRFGLPLILSPLMFCLGTYIFYKILPSLENNGFLENGTTLHNFVGQAFNSTLIRYTSGIISILGYLGIFVIEIYVGIKIFSIFTSSGLILTVVAIVLMVFIFCYVYLGGFKAVIDTDKFQFFLITTGTILSLVVIISASLSKPLVNPVQLFPFPGLLPLPFIIVMIVGNVPFQILRMAQWQRAALVGKREIIERGLKRGIIYTFIFWLAFIALGLLLFWVVGIKDSGVIALLNFLKVESYFTSLIVYPLIFTAFLAALISTSDSTFISILTTYIYDFRLYTKLHDNYGNGVKEIDNKLQKEGLLTARKAILFILLAGGVLYYLLVEILKFNFIDLLFVFFNQQLSLFPAVIMAIKAPNGKASKARLGAFMGMIMGWLSVWIISIYGKSIANQDLVLYSAAIAWLISIVVAFIFSPKEFIKILSR